MNRSCTNCRHSKVVMDAEDKAKRICTCRHNMHVTRHMVCEMWGAHILPSPRETTVYAAGINDIKHPKIR